MIGRSSSNPVPAARPAGRRPITAILAAIVWTLSLLSLATGLLLAPWSGAGAVDIPTAVASSLAVISLVTVGAILVVRLPRNLIGWLLLGSGLSIAVNLGTSGLADYGLSQHPGSVPGAVWMALLSNVTWVPFIICLGFYLPLLYPSGHLPSRRWRPVAASGLIAIAFLTIQNVLAPFPTGSFPPADQNPLAVSGPPGDLVSLLGAAATLIGLAMLPLIVASLVLRYRHAAGIERQQLKWLAAVMAIAGPALLVAIISPGGSSGIWGDLDYVAWLIVTFGFALLPVAIGIAVLRYRLYDIDLVIRRTLVYGALAGLLAIAYGGSVLLLSAVLAPLASENSLAVAGSTLLVAALFSPVRNGVRSVVDRRFYRSRYDASRELADLSQRLRGEVDLDGVQAEVLGTVARTLQPVSASMWLRDRH